MTAAEISFTAFATANALRLFAYLPQIAVLARDTEGARAISCTTWGLFLTSNVTTVAYAVLALDDWQMAAFFGANAACCVAILGLTISKRLRTHDRAPYLSVGAVWTGCGPRPAR